MKLKKLHKCHYIYMANCPNCKHIVKSSFKDSPVLTTICPNCDYCILEDEVDWRRTK